MGNCSATTVYVPSTETHQENRNVKPTQITCLVAQPSKQLTRLEDFQLIRTIGKGAFGYVMLANYKTNLVALKIMRKRTSVEMQQVQRVLSEKQILQAINFPFIVTFFCAFKDNAHLYLAMEFVSGGEMFVYLRNAVQLPEDHVRFYVAQIVLTFEYLHHLNIIYRNLKVEELLFQYDGYLKLIDFGLAKVVTDRTYTLCGTPEYMAPEIITGTGHNKGVDYWALGILTYEMIAGFVPFHDEDPMRIFHKIIRGEFEITDIFSSDVKDFIQKLLHIHPAKRCGNLQNGIDDIKSHPWFSTIRWTDLMEKRIKAPYIPESDKDHYETYDETELAHADANLYPDEFESF